VNADVAERVALDDEPECEGSERVDRGDVRYKLGPDPLPWSNGVAYARWRPEEVEQRAREIIAMFRERGVAFTWQIGPNTDAVGLSRVLAAQGLRREIDALLLTATIPIKGRLPEHDLRLVEELDERTRYLRCPSRRGGGVVAYRRDLPVGHGAWRYGTDGETVYLHMASTLQPHRRTGVYTAILGWRLDRAVRDGKTTAVVVAERASTAPILMRKGFREVGAVQIWMAV
jgi:hypothetical protein